MKILLRNNQHENWQLVQSAAYGAETELQRLLAEAPSLVSVNEVREGAGTLVAAVREFPLDVGMIDLVGFTANGDIAVIECKLSSNDEIKRKVIGQVLQYGANLWQMSYEELDEKVRLRSQSNLADLVREAVAEPDWDEELFRTNVEANLQSGGFILIIVVDEIRDELNRIVRYINDAGKPGFAFAALEMRRFHHGQTEMLVPHVLGSTKRPVFEKRAGKKWDEAAFFEDLEARAPDAMSTARAILEWAKTKKELSRIYWGEGIRTGSFVPIIHHNNQDHQLFAVYTYGTIEIYFQFYLHKLPFTALEKRTRLLAKLNAIPGVQISDSAISKRPNIKLSVISKAKADEQLLAIWDWVIEEILSV